MGGSRATHAGGGTPEIINSPRLKVKNIMSVLAIVILFLRFFISEDFNLLDSHTLCKKLKAGSKCHSSCSFITVGVYDEWSKI